MSDEDWNIDIKNHEADNSDSSHGHSNHTKYTSEAEKRANHNDLDQQRREVMKEGFSILRDSVPGLRAANVTSRSEILEKATEYVQSRKRQISSRQREIDEEKRQINLRLSRLRTLVAKIIGSYSDSESESADSDRFEFSAKN